MSGCLKEEASRDNWKESHICCRRWKHPEDRIGIFSKCPQNKMAYEMIMVYHLHMPFFIALFPCILT